MSELSAQDVLDFIRREPDKLCEALRREHRTHQQTVAGSLVKVIKSLATHDTDMRNESCVLWAKVVSKIDAYFPYV